MNKLAAECLGTFALVFAGCGAIVVNDLYGGAVTHVGIALTFGLVVMVIIYAVGELSGAHLNPAVTLGFFVSGRFAGKNLLPYFAAQVTGALVAALLLKVMFPLHPTLGATVPADTAGRAFAMEFVLTFLLMFVILNVSTGSKEQGIMAGVAVGGTVALEALLGGPVSGASMNPARSLAPALVAASFDYLWIYLSATFLGALSAVPAFRLVRGK